MAAEITVNARGGWWVGGLISKERLELGNGFRVLSYEIS